MSVWKHQQQAHVSKVDGQACQAHLQGILMVLDCLLTVPK